MKALVTIVLVLMIGINVFQMWGDKKQNAEIAGLKTQLESSLKTDTIFYNTLLTHENRLNGADHFFNWCLPILEDVKADTVQTWKEYADTQRAKQEQAAKEPDNKK
jgi:hypothetical protein